VSFAIERAGMWPIVFFVVEVAGGVLLWSAVGS
jgi:hypothetical protein